MCWSLTLNLLSLFTSPLLLSFKHAVPSFVGTLAPTFTVPCRVHSAICGWVNCLLPPTLDPRAGVVCLVLGLVPSAWPSSWHTVVLTKGLLREGLIRVSLPPCGASRWVAHAHFTDGEGEAQEGKGHSGALWSVGTARPGRLVLTCLLDMGMCRGRSRWRNRASASRRLPGPLSPSCCLVECTAMACPCRPAPGLVRGLEVDGKSAVLWRQESGQQPSGHTPGQGGQEARSQGSRSPGGPSGDGGHSSSRMPARARPAERPGLASEERFHLVTGTEKMQQLGQGIWAHRHFCTSCRATRPQDFPSLGLSVPTCRRRW